MDAVEKTRIDIFVRDKINILTIDRSDSKGEKAVWRHAFARNVCEDMRAWSLLQRDIPTDLAGRGGYPSFTENAAYMAIAAFAACGSNTKDITLGQAVSALGDSARDRFTRLEKSRTLDEMWRNLKDMLKLISSKRGTGLDYSVLAKELTDWQFDHLRTIRKWERDYYKNSKRV